MTVGRNCSLSFLSSFSNSVYDRSEGLSIFANDLCAANSKKLKVIVRMQNENVRVKKHTTNDL